MGVDGVAKWRSVDQDSLQQARSATGLVDMGKLLLPRRGITLMRHGTLWRGSEQWPSRLRCEMSRRFLMTLLLSGGER
jgi:hypothetical protein